MMLLRCLESKDLVKMIEKVNILLLYGIKCLNYLCQSVVALLPFRSLTHNDTGEKMEDLLEFCR
jgi:hypothetical protein